jgi:predicted nucleic acid-binding protein
MPDKENILESKVTFNSKRFKQTLNSHKEVLDKYFAGFEQAASLDGDIPIFLDTNVLLRIYSTSFKAREKLKGFLEENKDRIVLTHQVQWEYIKNRENVINKFSKDVTKELPNSFAKNILNPLNSFIESNKIVVSDYAAIEKGLDDLNKQARKLAELIETEIEKKNVSTSEIIFNDKFIELFREVTLLEALPKEFLALIKKDYDENTKDFEKTDIEKKSFKTFPGCGEKPDKMDDKHSDFIIYHEILEYSKKNDCDAIFLTYDTTKGDWMQVNKSPHLHYVDNFHLNTGRLIYIIDAERTLNKILDANFKSLVKKEYSSTNIDVTTLNELINNYPSFASEEKVILEPRYVDELTLNGINNIEDLQELLENAISALPFIKERRPNLNRIGLYRACLIVLNPSYKMIDARGKIINSTTSVYQDVRKRWLMSSAS